MCVRFGATKHSVSKKIRFRVSFLAFLLFLRFYERLWEGVEKQRGCQNSSIAASLRQRRFDVHVKWCACVGNRTRGIAKAMLLECSFAPLRISVNLFVEIWCVFVYETRKSWNSIWRLRCIWKQMKLRSKKHPRERRGNLKNFVATLVGDFWGGSARMPLFPQPETLLPGRKTAHVW